MSNEPTAVVAAFTAEGEVTPQHFEWKGTRLAVEGVGRCWAEAGKRHFNVIAMGGRLFELELDPGTLRWSIVRGPTPRLAA